MDSYHRLPSPHLDEEEADIDGGNSVASTSNANPVTRIRRRRRQPSYRHYETDEDDDFEHIPPPENQVEAHRMVNNYMFGFKKWKSHVTERPLESRSEIIKELYAEAVSPSNVPTVRPGNIFYAVFFGWWLCLLYCIIGVIMYLTVIGRHYGPFCFNLGFYFLWPFGKFVHRENPKAKVVVSNGSLSSVIDCETTENEPLIADTNIQSPLLMEPPENNKYFSWRDPGTYVWILLGLPLLMLAHLLIFIFTWLVIVMIPISKINIKTMRLVLFMPPKRLRIDKSSMPFNLEDVSLPASDVLLYTHQAVNVYYYKYSVDGVNVIAMNLLIFVVVALVVGYLNTPFITSQIKFFMSMLAIIPLAYYIGLGITSLSAQSSYAVGAVLNATFGSIVEITLYILALRKGKLSSSNNCYVELVKSGLVGTLLATMMFIPGVCMVIGGLKHDNQVFNPKSAGLSSTLLFVSVACTFSPTIYSKAFGMMHCSDCRNVTQFDNSTGNGTKWTLECGNCVNSIFGADGDTTMYDKHIRPLVYTCAILLPLAYIIGMIFSLKTHRADIYENFQDTQSVGHSHGHSDAHWGRIKSAVILLIATVLVCLCADIMTENIQDILLDSGLTVYFIGVTLVALVPNIPEIVNGIQFAMYNNISLSIELGSCIAVQVCMLQVPMLVLADIIYPMDFYLVFKDIHVWSVIFSVLMMNYVFQDGKSNYFQGSALCFAYFALIALYFFAPNVNCDLNGS